MRWVRTAVTKHHSPSQSSVVQLNAPPWQTLEKIRRRGGKSDEGQNKKGDHWTMRHQITNNVTQLSPSGYNIWVSKQLREMKWLTACLLFARLSITADIIVPNWIVDDCIAETMEFESKYLRYFGTLLLGLLQKFSPNGNISQTVSIGHKLYFHQLLTNI